MAYSRPVKKTVKKKPTKAVPKGFHKMPNGKLMKGAKHPTKAKRRK